MPISNCQLPIELSKRKIGNRQLEIGNLWQLIRSVARSAAWQIAHHEARANAASDSSIHHQWCNDSSRTVWSGVGAEEHRHDIHLGTLSRRAGFCAAICRKLLLPRLSVHAGAKSRAQVLSSGAKLAHDFCVTNGSQRGCSSRCSLCMSGGICGVLRGGPPG